MAKLSSGLLGVGPGAAGLDQLDYTISSLFDYSDAEFTPTEVRYFNNSKNDIVFTGENLTGDFASGFTGGTITSIRIQVDDTYVMELEAVEIDAKDLFDAGVADPLKLLWTLALGGDDNIIGTSLKDNLFGYAGNDFITGSDGKDVISGGAGHDSLAGGAGADNLSGGAGFDAGYYASSNAGVTVDLSLSGPQVSAGDANGDILSGIETLVGSATAGDELTGDSGQNFLSGLGGADNLDGGKGDDALQGGLGADFMFGGAGNDSASYALAAVGVTIELSIATPQVSAGEASGDVLVGIESLVGSRFDDIFRGNRSDNSFFGNAGADLLDGKGGNDTAGYQNSSIGVTIDLTLTTAQASAGDGDGDILSNIENLFGSSLADRFLGSDADNVLTGGFGGDTLNGRGGSDKSSYAPSVAGVTIDLNLTGPQVSEGDGGGDVLKSIENLIGSRFDDTCIGTDGPMCSRADSAPTGWMAGPERTFSRARAASTRSFSLTAMARTRSLISSPAGIRATNSKSTLAGYQVSPI